MNSVIVSMLLLAAQPAAQEPAADTAPVEVTQLSPLQEIDLLTAAGAPQLAVEVLGTSQPDYHSDPAGWRHHERVRVDILRRSGQWQALADRLEDLPEQLTLADHRWTATVRAQALLELGKFDEALAIARTLIWTDQPVATVELQSWRRILIQAMRGKGDLQGARIAIRRFQQDYADDSRDWMLERSRIAIQVGEPSEAVVLLADVKGPDAEVLKIIADFRSDSQAAARVIDRAVKLGIDKSLEPSLRREAWAIAAEAAGSINSRAARIAALERGLVLPAGSRPTLAPLSADDLWDDYLALGTELGNELQLIVGDDDAWFIAASNRYDDQPIHARALFAVVALKAYREEKAAIAHWQFAELLTKVPSGGELMQALYLNSSRFDGPEDVPPQVGYLLLEQVLSIPDIPLASEILQSLEASPPETDPFEWQLRRARVLLLGGNLKAGIEGLENLFKETAGSDNFDRSKVLQVVFDLQTLDQHVAALGFLERLARMETDGQRQRELWYWRADSLAALEQHAEAARAYLRSALLLDPFAADPWAQTSRFQAADQLLAAGMFDDARRQFRTLLNSTRDPGRQAVIRNRLQELQLRAQNSRPAESEGNPEPVETVNESPVPETPEDATDDGNAETVPFKDADPDYR